MALVAFRRGNLQAALDHLELVPIDDFEKAERDGEGITHHYCDDFKAVAIKAMVLNELGKSKEAVDELRRLSLIMPRIRKWAEDNKKRFGLEMRLYYSIEVLFDEAVGQLSNGMNKEKWLSERSAGATEKASSMQSKARD